MAQPIQLINQPMTRRKPGPRLTPDSFARLLSSLAPDPCDAGARYETLRGRLILFFLRRLLASPEDLADEVIDRLARRILEGEQLASVEAYALGIARHVAQEQAAAQSEDISLDKYFENTLAAAPTTSSDRNEQDRQLDAMERSLTRLPKEEAELLTTYYLAEQKEKIATRRRMATRMGLTQAGLRKKIFLICSKMRSSIRAELGAE